MPDGASIILNASMAAGRYSLLAYRCRSADRRRRLCDPNCNSDRINSRFALGSLATKQGETHFNSYQAFFVFSEAKKTYVYIHL
jgi:hypothetical protein